MLIFFMISVLFVFKSWTCFFVSLMIYIDSSIISSVYSISSSSSSYSLTENSKVLAAYSRNFSAVFCFSVIVIEMSEDELVLVVESPTVPEIVMPPTTPHLPELDVATIDDEIRFPSPASPLTSGRSEIARVASFIMASTSASSLLSSAS